MKTNMGHKFLSAIIISIEIVDLAIKYKKQYYKKFQIVQEAEAKRTSQFKSSQLSRNNKNKKN